MNTDRQLLFRVATIDQSLIVHLRGQMEFLDQYFNVEGIACHTEAMQEAREKHTIKINHKAFKREISPFSDLISLIDLSIFFYRRKPLIVHSLTPKAGLIAMLSAWLVGVPIRMHTFTGLIFPHKRGAMRILLQIMDSIICRCATSVYPEGNAVLKELINARVTKKPLKILGNGNINGVDLKYFSSNLPTEDNLISASKQCGFHNFLFVGRLVKDKGIEELIDSFLICLKANPRIRLFLCGDFDQNLNPIDELTRDLIHSKNEIVLLGWKDDIRPYLKSADCMVFPSHREGFPNVVLQAGAMKLPIIATNIDGTNEIIIDGYNGILVAKGSNQDLINAMLWSLANPEKMKDLSEKLFKDVNEKWPCQLIWEATLDEYFGQLNSKKHAKD